MINERYSRLHAYAADQGVIESISSAKRLRATSVSYATCARSQWTLFEVVTTSQVFVRRCSMRCTASATTSRSRATVAWMTAGTIWW